MGWQGSSSNTGFEELDKALFYFVQRADSNVSFVLVHDKPGDGTLLTHVHIIVRPLPLPQP
jgi:hypothetical protein